MKCSCCKAVLTTGDLSGLCARCEGSNVSTASDHSTSTTGGQPVVFHRWDYCGLCDAPYVICGRCGNNCCNGGTGNVEDGTECGCAEAYALQQAGPEPEFPEEYKQKKREEYDRMMAKLFTQPEGEGT